MLDVVVERFEIPVGSFTFRARAAGPRDGRPVLFLHGVPQTGACWTSQLHAVAAAGYRGVAFDQRGYSPGARPDDVDAYRKEHLVGDVLAVADHLGFTRFDLVGHDFGGWVAWAVASHHPDRVRTVAVASTPHPGAFSAAYRSSKGSDQHERSGYIRAIQHTPRGQFEDTMRASGSFDAVVAGLPEEAVAEYRALLAEPGALEAMLDWYRATGVTKSTAVPPCPVPALYVWSDQDPALGPEAAARTADWVTSPYRFVTLTGVGHWIPELAADAFNEALLTHLDSHAEADAT